MSIRVLVVQNGKVTPRQIEKSTRSMRELINGYPEHLFFPRDEFALVFDEEGRYTNKQPTARILQGVHMGTMLLGTVLVVGLCKGGTEYGDVPAKVENNLCRFLDIVR